jgi:hypothetical protein
MSEDSTMTMRSKISKQLRVLGSSVAVGLMLALLAPAQAFAGPRGFGGGHHGGFHRAGGYGGAAARGYARGFNRGSIRGMYGGGAGYGYGYGTGFNSTRYAMYSARHSQTDYTGIPFNAKASTITRPGLIMAQSSADQQYLAAVEQARAMNEESQGGTPQNQPPQGQTSPRQAVPVQVPDGTANVAPPEVGTLFATVPNAQSVIVGDKTYFVSNGVYFKAYYEGNDVVYRVVETPKEASNNN